MFHLCLEFVLDLLSRVSTWMGDRLGTRGAVGFLLFVHALRIYTYVGTIGSILISMGT